ncbi:DUF6755 family protein [Polyangium aurulentum]|uniref:DUF6755 family protein n=1 Tax=Polyangium aurulentum TaxID=2567896 RepID=UPI0010AE2BC7|nr:DUF6755 family protein [Polyangium aurulentum]UQA62946.1 hypothetical protein E8A73_021810 [Polyangium aurulentum]
MLSGQGNTLLTGINALIGLLVAIQLWLVSASLEALYNDETGVLVPALVASFVLFLMNAGLLRHALGFDRRRRHEIRNAAEGRRG